jgi:hypothetical protein
MVCSSMTLWLIFKLMEVCPQTGTYAEYQTYNHKPNHTTFFGVLFYHSPEVLPGRYGSLMIGCHHITHHVLPSRYMMVRRGIISKWPKISSWCGCCNSARFIFRIATLIHLKQHIPPESGYGSTCFCPPKCMVWDLTWPYFFHKFSFISHGCTSKSWMVTTGDLPWLVSTRCFFCTEKTQ